MGKLSKIIRKFLTHPPEVRFEEVEYLLKEFGYIQIRSKGSHHTFENADGDVIVIPKKGGKIAKRTYAEKLIKLLDLENWQNDN
ncbi:type II toxin-antitoxin system HicA family toxin [Synechocystis salina LEGE 06099]|uniref:type II toxin-antitoxin system HicA family toxin n=1 Tax=Synechocystis salina TaxID=945780 RepID=UPI00188145B4|nr:type II toxin-antitoxin system HicA family toxin [Synechocystis salina]MBE9202770.1 type II toxin-antitoxin system HicA family toxin [Synechocystis salina LEGE 06099]